MVAVNQTRLYSKKIFENADCLLVHLLSTTSESLCSLTKIKILVVGAGTFPSFYSLIKAIKQKNNKLHKIDFTLVDPDDKATLIFTKTSSCSDLKIENIEISCNIFNDDIKKIILSNKNKRFDVIYFENPESSILNTSGFFIRIFLLFCQTSLIYCM